jgi:hypothetical protein
MGLGLSSEMQCATEMTGRRSAATYQTNTVLRSRVRSMRSLGSDRRDPEIGCDAVPMFFDK